jgi:amidase
MKITVEVDEVEAASDWAFASSASQLAALRQGKISSLELLETYLERIWRHNHALNAIVSIDEERARQKAREADDARANGEALGPLHGLPITVKDSFMTAGLRTTCGDKAFANFIPTRDAEAIARLRAAGAVIIGKTNMPTGNQDLQAVNPLFGETSNPFNLARTSGGSAGGGAAAVAAGLSSVEYASEIGGSTRVPAHFCGLYGHKTTFKAIPMVGHIPYGPETSWYSGEMDMACVGVMARSPDDIFPLLSATVGPLPRDAHFPFSYAPPRATALKDFRVAAWFDEEDCSIDASVRSAIETVISAVEKAGGTVVRKPTSLPVKFEDSYRVFERLVYGAFSTETSTVTPAFVANTVWRLIQRFGGDPLRALSGLEQKHKSWIRSDNRRQHFRDGWADFFNSFDVLLMPVTPTAAPPHHRKVNDRFGRTIQVDGVTRSYWDQMKWSSLANIAGSPATAFPVSSTADGMPVGVQVMGPCGGDLTTIAFARAITPMVEGYRKPPNFV